MLTQTPAPTPTSSSSPSHTPSPYTSTPHQPQPRPPTYPLFYRAPCPTSSPSSPATPHPHLSPADFSPRSPHSRGRRDGEYDSFALSYYTNASSPDGSNYIAHLPPVPSSSSTAQTTSDPTDEHNQQQQVDIIDPKTASDQMMYSAGKAANTHFQLDPHPRPQSPSTPPPPPVPPKSLPSTTPYSTKSGISTITADTDTHSASGSGSGETHIDTRPSTAIRGRRASASSHHILAKPSLASLVNTVTVHSAPRASHDEDEGPRTQTQRESFRIASALAKLPRAEPPPRQPSPFLPSPFLASRFVTATPLSTSGGRTPTYSFLASDPVTTPNVSSHSRRSSRASTASISSSMNNRPPSFPGFATGEELRGNPLDFPVSPSLAHTLSWNDHRRFSAQSGYSGMADAPTPLPPDPTELAAGAGSGSGSAPASKDISPNSAMATKASKRSSSRFSFRRSFSTKSRSTARTKSTKSSRSTKRGSTSTLGHRFAGRRWEVLPDLPAGERAAEGQVGGEDIKLNEEMMEPVALVGRAAVLERMLRAGKRISNQSMHRGKARLSLSSLHHRFASTSGSSFHRASPSLPPVPVPGREQKNGKGKQHSNSASTSASASASTHTHGQKRRSGSAAASLRQRLSRRLQRRQSREDTFTELDSDSDDDPGLFPDLRRNKSQSQRRSHFVGRAVQIEGEEVMVMRVVEEERAGGKGVMVFPEEVEKPPAVPEKDNSPATGRSGGLGATCASVGCISPTSPTPLLAHALDRKKQRDVEKGLPRSANTEAGGEAGDEGEAGEGGERVYNPQSPHLGHRSPDWGNRQSVISYISTGQWKDPQGRLRTRWVVAVCIGGGMAGVLVLGLLVGLLVRRGEEGS